jgi:hypothetical protein
VAKFALEDGEKMLHRERVSDAHTWVGCELILTDRRIVLTSRDTKRRRRPIAHGFIAAVIEELLAGRKTYASHEIRRARFTSVERIGKREVKIDGTGEGFKIATEHADEWVAWIHAWATGETPEPLPPAKLVDR